MIGFGQTVYTSNKQSYFTSNFDRIDQEANRKIIMFEDSVIIELFNGEKINSKTKFEQNQDDGKGNLGKRYSVDNYESGLIVFYDKKIFLNIEIEGGQGSYYLSNSNHTFLTEEEKKIEAEELDYQTTKKLYGELTANCIREKRICIGMSWMGVFKILGEAKKQDTIKSSYKTSVILSYDDVTIYCEMKKDGVFVEKIHYHNY